VLVVGGAPGAGAALCAALPEGEVRGRTVESVEAAVQALDGEDFDAVLLAAEGEDEGLPGLIGRFGEIPVIVTAAGGGKSAVAAVRAGAADFIDLPAEPEELAYVLGRVFAAHAVDPLRPPASEVSGQGLLGGSKAMEHVLAVVGRVASGNATALIRGESGTGKELVARALHAQSPRSGGPFVKVHCAGLPETLLESELFGYEKGAFTGATSRKPGRVEVAEGGTLFLDEIGDITPAMQVKLLRLLQDREYERLGGNATLRADVRFVAATHRDLEHMIKKGEFREDLFYRLNVVPIWLPPLRARRDDVAQLARHFCTVFGEVHGKRGVGISDDAVAALAGERWPGNVRQLQNLVERLVVLTPGKVIGAEDVRREMAPPITFATQASGGPGTLGTSGASGTSTLGTSDGGGPASSVMPLDAALKDAERRAIERALRHAKDNRTLAARLLGVSRATLYTKLEEHGIVKRADG
jgi:two-component system response regulator AtoC